MLTILARDLDGNESVFSAKHVIANRTPRSENVRSVECYNEKYEPLAVAGNTQITHGTVFVMNDNGKTVATYYLAQDPS